MDDEQFQAWLAQHGGEVGRKDNEKTADDPTSTAPLGPGEKRPQVTSVDTTTVTAKDGATITLRRNPGPYVGSQTPYTVIENTPAKPLPASQQPRTPAEQAADAKALQDQKESEANAALPKDQDPQYETNAARAARAERTIAQQRADANTAADNKRADEAAAATRALQNKPVVTLTDDGKGGKVAVITTPDGKVSSVPVPGVQGTPPQIKVGETIYERGPDGKYAPAAGLPSVGPDNPSVAGPEMPTIVLGASQAALQQYKQKLQEGVAAKLWSQKWANDRWGEATQVAATAVQEAATQQARDASTLNATINIATTKATNAQNGITTALDYVNKINGLLPEGSPLGGQTFAALLGIQMLMQARSGLDAIDPSGKKPVPVPTLSAADMTSQNAIAAKRAEIQAHPVFRPQPPTNVQPTTTAAAVSAPPASSTPVTPAAPAPSPDLRNSSDMNLPPGTPTAQAPGNEQPSDILTLQGADGSIAYITRANWDQSTPEAKAGTQVINAENGAAFQQHTPTVQGQPGQPFTVTPPPSASSPMSDSTPTPPDYGAPGMTVLPQPAPPAPLPPNEVTQTPRQEWPVLANYQPTAMAPPRQPDTQPPSSAPSYPVLGQYGASSTPSTSEQTSPTQYPAILHSEAASTPFWQMSPEQVAAYQQAGVPQDVIEGPGRRVAA